MGRVHSQKCNKEERGDELRSWSVGELLTWTLTKKEGKEVYLCRVSVCVEGPFTSTVLHEDKDLVASMLQLAHA
jgi:hypothetical protein